MPSLHFSAGTVRAVGTDTRDFDGSPMQAEVDMIEFDVKIEAQDLYNYMMAHAYNSASGLIGSCFGALMIVIFGLDPRQWIFLVCGVILLLYLPVSLKLKSKQIALTNPSFQKPLHYTLDEEGLPYPYILCLCQIFLFSDCQCTPSFPFRRLSCPRFPPPLLDRGLASREF